MRKKIAAALLTLLAPLMFVLSTPAPASAETFSNCVSRYSGISWNVQSFSVFGSLATARVRVHWNNCLSDTSFLTDRNNATFVTFSLLGDNCGLLDRVRFNLGSVEGLNIDTVSVNCVNNEWVTVTRSLASPGFTYARRSWSVGGSNILTPRGVFILSLPTNFNTHGPSLWGGRSNITQ